MDPAAHVDSLENRIALVKRLRDRAPQRSIARATLNERLDDLRGELERAEAAVWQRAART